MFRILTNLIFLFLISCAPSLHTGSIEGEIDKVDAKYLTLKHQIETEYFIDSKNIIKDFMIY